MTTKDGHGIILKLADCELIVKSLPENGTDPSISTIGIKFEANGHTYGGYREVSQRTTLMDVASGIAQMLHKKDEILRIEEAAKERRMRNDRQ